MHYKTMFITIKKGTLLTVNIVTCGMFLTLIRVNVKNRAQKGFFTVMLWKNHFLGPQQTVKNHFCVSVKIFFFFNYRTNFTRNRL